MKKTISLILCFVIALSVSLTAFAEIKEIVLDTVQSVTLGKGEVAEYSFTAPETAVYQVTFKELNSSCSDFLLKCNNEKQIGGLTFNTFYESKADTAVLNGYFTTYRGYKYTINISNCIDIVSKEEQKEYGLSETARLEFSIKKVELPEVELGGTYTVRGTVTDFFMADKYYCMTPKASGYYNFCSQSNGIVAPQLEVFSDECASSFGGGYHKPFDITIYMEKDHLYIIDISAIAFDFDENNSNPQKAEPFETQFAFSIKDGSNIKVESITAYEEKISLTRNWYCFGYCDISPSNFTPFDSDKITVTSSNPRVADTCNHYLFQNTFQFEIDSYHYGKTTITVTLPNGLSTSFKVYVKPRIIIKIEDFFTKLFNL